MTGAAEAIGLALRSGTLEVTRLAEGSGVVLHVPSLGTRTLNPAGMILLDALAAGAGSDADLADYLIMSYDIDRATALRDAEAFSGALVALLGPAG